MSKELKQGSKELEKYEETQRTAQDETDVEVKEIVSNEETPVNTDKSELVISTSKLEETSEVTNTTTHADDTNLISEDDEAGPRVANILAFLLRFIL